MKAISQTYRKRGYPPWNQPKAQTKDKTALELSAVLVRECWTLFESVWQVRNDILHSKDRHSYAPTIATGHRRTLPDYISASGASLELFGGTQTQRVRLR